MITVIIVLCVSMAVVGCMTEKKIINPLTVFYGIWIIIFYLYSLKLYNLNTANEKTLFWFVLGFIFFAVGYYIIRTYAIRKNTILKIKKIEIGIRNREEFELRYNIIYYICFICVVFYALEAINSIRYLLSGSTMAFIRQMAQANAESGGGLMDAIGTIFLNPIVMALQPIVACDVWYGKKSKKLLILNVIILFFRTLTDGSRSTLIYFAFHFFIAFILYFGKRTKRQKEVDISKDKKKKNKKIVRVMIIVAIFFIVLTTISRSGNSAVRYAYLYFTMEPYMMEIWASKVDAAGLAGYGLASTNGFSFFVLYLLKNFRVLSDYPMFWHTINNIIAETESQWQIITSTGTMANAYVSLFWYFYLDGGVIGIIVGSFVYGGFCAKYYWNAMKNMSPRTVAIYCFIIQGLFMSFVRFQFGNITYATAFVVLMLAYKRSNKR